MNKNIDLGTFEWDISKIEAQLIENRKQIEAFSGALAVNKKALNDEKKEIQQLGSEIATMKALQKDANTQLKNGTLSQAEYNKTIADSNAVIAQNEARIREVASAQSAHIKTILEQERAVKELRLETNELNKMFNAGREDIVGNEYAYRNLNKELNALKTESKNLGSQLVQLRKAGKENTQEYRDLENQWKKVSAEADALNEEFKGLDKVVGDNQRSVGDYTDSIKKAFSDIPDMIASGDIKGALNATKEGLSGVFDVIKANPWILVLTGIAAFVKEMWEYNSQVKELNTTVEQLANTSGTVTDELRKNATAIQETYGRDFSESVREMSSLMQDFGVSADEAFRIYNEGLAMGGSQNTDFGDSIREYGPLFEQAGYTAEEFVNILNAGIDLGIYSDKLPDAIKEAGLALKEQTKSTRDALVNAFGATFTDDILKRVQSGRTTVADALSEISEKAEDANLNQQQLAQLTADVFKGAGEDAGGALVIFEAINKSQETQTENLTDLEVAVIALAEKNRELADAKDEAFKSDSAIEFQQTVNNVWKDIQISWFKYLGSISKNTQKEIDSLKLIFFYLKDTITSIPQAFSIIMGGLNKDFKQLGDIARAVGNVFANMFNPDALKNAVNSLYSQINNFTSFTKKSISEVGTMGDEIFKKNKLQIAAQRKASTDAAKAQAEAEKLLSGSGSGTTGSVKDAADKAAADAAKSNAKKVADAQKAAAAAQKAAEEAAKKQLELAKQNADLTADIAKTELAEYIANNAAKLDSDKRLTEEKLADQIKYFDVVNKLATANNSAELEKALLGKTEEEKVQIRKKFAIQEQEIVNDTNAKKAAITSQYNQQIAEDENLMKAIEFQQKLIDMETNGATEFELQRALNDNEMNARLEDNQRLLESEKISQENFLAQKQLLESNHAANSKAITDAETDAKMAAYGDMFGNIGELLGKDTAAGKAAALAQVAISQGLAIARIWEQKSVLPSPFGVVQKVLETGVAVGNVVKAAAQINSVKAARGMLIDGPSHAQGGVPIEAEGGEVIINKRSSAMFRGLLSEINASGGGVRFANGGIVGSNLASVQRGFKSSGAVTISDDAINAIAAAIYSGSQQGIGDMADNRKIANNANF